MLVAQPGVDLLHCNLQRASFLHSLSTAGASRTIREVLKGSLVDCDTCTSLVEMKVRGIFSNGSLFVERVGPVVLVVVLFRTVITAQRCTAQLRRATPCVSRC